jgi:hypothetical protein
LHWQNVIDFLFTICSLKRLDREWYGIDDGYDESNNSFAGMSEEFLARKNEKLQQKWKRKVSFHQQQRNRVSRRIPFQNGTEAKYVITRFVAQKQGR